MDARAGQGTRSFWKVGELAERTGLSVRALHYYEEIGLLSPGRGDDSGHRVYSSEDVLRLQRIVSLRALGLSLGEVRECLDGRDFPARRVVDLHLARLRGQIEAQKRLYERLEAVASRLDGEEEASAEMLVETAMEVISLSEQVEKYYTPEQLEYLAERRQELGEERIREVEAEWPRLMAEVRAEMERGTDPSDERAQRLARRWTELVEAFTGGDSGIRRSLGNVWKGEEEGGGLDAREMRGMMEYVNRALEASNDRG